MSEQKIKIGISIGDMNGIGPEIIIKTLQKNILNKYFTPIIYGSTRCLSYYKRLLNINSFNYTHIKAVRNATPQQINVLNCWTEEIQITPGKPTAETAKAAYTALERASTDLKNGLIDALVTAPVNKGNIAELHKDFVGQTEYISQIMNADESLMLLVSDQLRVGLVTNHISISKIKENITKERLQKKITLMIASLKQDFLINKPRIAVMALNPHAGDSGKMGMEEENIIKPVIDDMKADNLIYGPYPADSFFGSQNLPCFDGILAMYHDQGLAPFKALSFGEGVNITCGLSVVRTSPDHGTAYDIAGQNKASIASLRKALFTACDIVKNRSNYKDMNKNPLNSNLAKKASAEA